AGRLRFRRGGAGGRRRGRRRVGRGRRGRGRGAPRPRVVGRLGGGRAARSLLEFLQVRAELDELAADGRVETRSGCRSGGAGGAGGACRAGAARARGRRRRVHRRVRLIRAEQRRQARIELRVGRAPVGLRRDQLVEVGDDLRDLRTRV